AASANQPYTNIGGTAKKGHPFAEHGAHLSDSYQFARAKKEGQPVSRWNSFAEQEAMISQVRSKLQATTTPKGDPACAINADGWKAIGNGKITAADILDNPLTHQKYLKSKVEYKKQPAGKVVGKEFHPDGVTTRDVEHITIIFELDNTGQYQVLTAFPEHP
ncbi:MAG TPA: hypothetical protein V6C85_35750, partial [Allocoleopsis sp.]